jgi:hypothetical protein
MKRSLIRFGFLALLAWLICYSPATAQDAKSQAAQKAKAAAKAEKKEFPFEAQEIRISESEIYVRTKDGEEFLVGADGEIRIPTLDHKSYILRGEEPIDEIILDDGKIKIGDEEFDLKNLESLEALEKLQRIKIPRVRITPRMRTGEGVFKMGSDVVVEEDESVDGDVVSLFGSVTVKGAVSGDAVAIGGDVDVQSTGMVEGNAVSIGGSVIKRGGAVVEGEKISVGFFRGQPLRISSPFIANRFPVNTISFITRFFKILLLIFLGIVVISVAPKQTTKVKAKIEQNFLKSGLVGLLAQILILPIFILLIITIIGIPLALLLEPILILIALVLGYTAVCMFVGEKIKQHTSLRPDTRIMILIIGILAVELVPLTARMIGVFGGVFSPLVWIITVIGWLIGYVVITVGFGAAVMTRLGTRPKDTAPVPNKASPPETNLGTQASV